MTKLVQHKDANSFTAPRKPFLTTREASAYCGFKTTGGFRKAAREGRITRPQGVVGARAPGCGDAKDLETFCLRTLVRYLLRFRRRTRLFVFRRLTIDDRFPEGSVTRLGGRRREGASQEDANQPARQARIHRPPTVLRTRICHADPAHGAAWPRAPYRAEDALFYGSRLDPVAEILLVALHPSRDPVSEEQCRRP